MFFEGKIGSARQAFETFTGVASHNHESYKAFVSEITRLYFSCLHEAYIDLFRAWLRILYERADWVCYRTEQLEAFYTQLANFSAHPVMCGVVVFQLGVLA